MENLIERSKVAKDIDVVNENNSSENNITGVKRSLPNDANQDETNNNETKRSRNVINLKYEDELENYEEKVAFVTKLQDELWGYGHINKENLVKCASTSSNL